MVSLLVVAGFISVLIVVSFINGMSLVNFMTEYDNIFLEQDKLNYLYRASFYYTNILFVVGPVAIISLVAMFTADTIIYKLIFMGLLLMLFSTLFIMFAKTAFVTLAITLLILAFIYFSNRKYYKINNRVTQYLFLFFMLLFQMGVINMLANTSDFYELRPDSFSQRLIVASSAFETLSMHPENFFFGYGPDSSIRLISDTMDSDRFSGESIEGAIDSTYVTILFEYGFVFMFLFLIFGVHTLLRLFWCIKRNAKMQHILITLFSVIIFIYIAAISQRIGTSKVAWIIVQIFALAGICLTQNINNQSHIKSHL